MGKIKVINTMELDPIEMEGLGDDVVVRPAIGPAQGSNRIQILHSIVEEGFEAEAVPSDGQDEVAYVISGEVELESGGTRHRLGPGSLFFVPPKTTYKYRVIKGPHEVIGIFSPPGQE